MRVVKRNGSFEDVSFDKVLKRIKNLSNGLNINVVEIAQKVCSRIYDGVHTYELDDLAAQICSSLIVDHPDYDMIATRITISNHHKRTSPSFSETIQILYDNYNESGEHTPLVSKNIYDITMNNKDKLNTYIQYDRDYNYNYFGFKTLEKSYLFRKNGVVIERPQHLLMRVALGIHEEDFKDALETYDAMSSKKFIHATPTLFNSGTPRPQMSSCFLAEVSDSIDGIYKSLQECAHISKYAGGIGLHIHKVRGKDSIIRGTNGKSSGIVPMLRVFNATARYVNQCFAPETIVYTDKGVKYIKDIEQGDKVLTRDGSYQPVIHSVKNKISKTICEITTKNSVQPVKCTKEHQIYAIRGQRKGMNYSVIKNRLQNQLIKPDYVSAGDLSEDDILGYPVSSKCGELLMNQGGELSCSFTDAFMYVYGTVLRFTSHRQGKNHMLYSNIPVIPSVVDALEKLKITYKFEKDSGVLEWESNDVMFPVDKFPDTKEFYMNELEKDLPRVKSFINGLFGYDGRISSKSQDMIYNIRRLGMQLGQLVSVTDSSKFVDNNKTYDVTLTSGKKTLSFIHDGMIWTRIQKVRELQYNGDVYDLNVKDNHNYTTDMGLVHNSGRRNGSIAMYLEPWHPDIYQFLEMKKNHGAEEQRARDLFYAMWIPDLFMERVEKDGMWSLMCPDACKDLCELYGEDFKKRYEEYENKGVFVKQVKAQDIWIKIMESQIETGTPYMLYKDSVNKKNNQKNLGTIKSSNLCVAGDTYILTSEGYKQIKSQMNRFVEVWNGFEWSNAQVQKTSSRAKIISVKFSNGRTIKCTPYHKFFINDPMTNKDVVVRAYELSLGMKLSHFNVPVISEFKEREEDISTSSIYEYDRLFKDDKDAYTTGFFHGKKAVFAWSVDDNRIVLRKNEQSAIGRLSYSHAYHQVNNTTFVYCNTSSQQLPRPPMNSKLSARVSWLSGYIDSVGCTQKDLNVVWTLNIDTPSYLMDQMYLMLCTMGVHPICDSDLRRIILCADDVRHLIHYGMRCTTVDLSMFDRTSPLSSDFSVKVVGVVDNNEYQETYCFTEHKKNRGMFDGVVIGNCTEITEYTDENETAVCNLASMCLPSYVVHEESGGGEKSINLKYDFKTLHKNVKIVVKNLNKIIDKNFYPVLKAEVSNMRHRPIGIGVQGLADTYLIMGMSFDSDDAAKLNRDIFETIYHAALEQSMEISRKRHEIIESHNDSETQSNLRDLQTYVKLNKYEQEANLEKSKYPGAYVSFDGCPASKGILQFDMWGVNVDDSKFNWTGLKDDIKKYGLRNSLLLAPMPTASTSQIMGFNEAFEPFTSNIYKRKTIAGEFIVINQYLIRDLIKLGIWNRSLKENILLEDGSIQNIKEIPQKVRDLYKIVWDIKQRVLIDQAADRGAFICQSQSMNLFMDDPTFSKLTSMHFYAWKKGLKTGLYYLRTKAKAAAQQFTIDPRTRSKWLGGKTEETEETEEGCVSCSA